MIVNAFEGQQYALGSHVVLIAVDIEQIGIFPALLFRCLRMAESLCCEQRHGSPGMFAVLGSSGMRRADVEIGDRGCRTGNGRRSDPHATRISRGELTVGRGLYGYFRHEPFERDLHGGRLPGRSDGLRGRAGHSEPCGAFGLRRHLVERTVIVRDLALGLASQVVQCADPGKGAAVGDGIETVRLPRCGVRYGNGRRLSRNLRSGEVALQYGVPVAVEHEQRERAYLLLPALGRRRLVEEGTGFGRLVRQGDFHYAARRRVCDLVGVLVAGGQHGQGSRGCQNHLFHRFN